MTDITLVSKRVHVNLMKSCTITTPEEPQEGITSSSGTIQVLVIHPLVTTPTPGHPSSNHLPGQAQLPVTRFRNRSTTPVSDLAISVHSIMRFGCISRTPYKLVEHPQPVPTNITVVVTYAMGLLQLTKEPVPGLTLIQNT